MTTKTMRTIKFRAWDKKRQEMRDGIPMVAKGSLNQLLLSGGFVNVACMGTSEDSDFIIMQFTGILDRNGREIYEGDVVEMGPIVGSIEFGKYVTDNEANEDILGWMICSDSRAHALDPQATVEIIGNIYQNPELLK